MLLWAVLGMPHLSPREGALSTLGLDCKSLYETQTTSLVKLSNSGPTLPCGVARRQQAGLPKGAGFRGAWGADLVTGRGLLKQGWCCWGSRLHGGGRVLLGGVPVFLVWMAEYGRSRAGAGSLGSGSGTCVQADKGSRRRCPELDLTPWASRPDWRSVGSGVTVC